MQRTRVCLSLQEELQKVNKALVPYNSIIERLTTEGYWQSPEESSLRSLRETLHRKYQSSCLDYDGTELFPSE